ncbi:MAG: 4Fe-4S binding protein [Nitrospirota bacterium]
MALAGLKLYLARNSFMSLGAGTGLLPGTPGNPSLRAFMGIVFEPSIGDRDACMECGACQRNCPSQAVTVNAGVGCASAVLKGFFRRTEPSCDCSSSGSSSCCG